MRQIRSTIVILLVASWANVANAQTEFEKLMAESDPAFQEQIDRTHKALQQSDVEVFREIQVLKDLSNDKHELVKQFAIYTAATESAEEFHVLLMLKIMHFLELPPSVPIRVLAPYLDSDNKKLRDFAREWFQGHDKAVGEDALSAYKSYLSGRLARNEEIPVAFIDYVYERLPPGKALEVFHFGRWPPQKKDNDVILAEHIVSNAIWLKENRFAERFQIALPEANAELAKLAKHEEWWVRLYVAWMMRRHPEVRQADVLQLLSADSNKLVSKAAKSVRRP